MAGRCTLSDHRTLPDRRVPGADFREVRHQKHYFAGREGVMGGIEDGAERARLAEEARREKNWKRWGPYLSARQWGTVREDYSPQGTSWEYFPHDHARSRAYR